jgi:cysteinyl-tRNA synthetase
MDDDLNTADAVSALFELTKEINTSLAENRLSYEDVEYASLEFEREAYILGILYARKNDDGENAELKELLEARAEARKNKDFAAADAIRAKIEELGYIVKDTRERPQLIKK